MEEEKLNYPSPMAEETNSINSSKTPSLKTQQNSPKPFPNFLYKAIFVFLLIAVLPLFPYSQSSESANKTIFSRSWELLHLLFVGIAISYGLFSSRNYEPEIEKESQQKTDTQQSYVSRIFQVSSVFDDEEIESPKGSDFPYETKNQASNYSQYYPEQPVIMVAEESTKEASSSAKPLFLPVRSLKSRSQHQEPLRYDVDESLFTSDEQHEFDKNGKIGGKESTVLPSPIPWRSRSGRMESPPPSPLSPPSPPNSTFDAEQFPSRNPSFRSRTPRSDSPSPEKLPNSTSPNQEIKGKMNEDFVRKKSFKRSVPPPPPPPPLPPKHASRFGLDKRDARKSFKNELEDKSRREFLYRDDLRSNSFRSDKFSSIGRSVRTVGQKEAQNLPPLPRNNNENRNAFIEDSENDDDDSEFSDVEEVSSPVSVRVAPEPEEVEVSKKANEFNHVAQEAAVEENEVDKKADEFIAKFREQIRLQRIASIKKSSGQRIARNAN